MIDPIDRRAAIDALDSIGSLDTDADREYARGIFNALPSAKPEIIRCKDCENWDTTWQNDWAKNYHYCPLIDGIRNGDWYCADAERRTE